MLVRNCAGKELSDYRPGQTLRDPGDLSPRISQLSAHESGKDSRTQRPPSTPGNTPGTHLC
jgi:hypothetical protein